MDTGTWTAKTLVGAAARDVSSTRVAQMAASMLNDAGIDTLGQLAALTDEELLAVRRIGPGSGGARVVRRMLDLWRAKQQSALETVPAGPSAAQPTYAAGPGPRAGQLEFPESSPLASAGRAARARPTRAGGRASSLPAQPGSPGRQP